MASFVLAFFSLDDFDEIWDVIESVFEGFLTYSFLTSLMFSHDISWLSRTGHEFFSIYKLN